MRRWLAAFLIALLSTQLSWAAVARYCQHEAATSGHFGHHEHQHHHKAADLVGIASVAADMADDQAQHADKLSSEAGTASPLTVDLDCGQCHGLCVGLNPAVQPRLPSLPSTRPVVPAVEGDIVASPERPERPNWTGLA